jgi:hypothetical protein
MTEVNRAGVIEMKNSGHVPPSLAEVGKRVSIRLVDRSEGGFRDLLGILTTPTTVQKKNGEVREFDPSDIFMWKVVEL